MVQKKFVLADFCHLRIAYYYRVTDLNSKSGRFLHASLHVPAVIRDRPVQTSSENAADIDRITGLLILLHAVDLS